MQINPNDQIREQILQWFYDRNDSAMSQYGKNGSAVKVSDAKKGLKDLYGLKQPEVMSNLTYLIDKGWLNRDRIEKTVQVKGGTIPSIVTWYEISSAGIDKIEGESEFQQNNRYPGINISATGQNVITLGNGNVVNAKYSGLHAQMDTVKKAIAESETIADEQKLDLTVDLETIRDQLAKAEPDKTIIQRLWARIEDVATLNDFSGAVTRLTPLIAGLIT